MSRARILGNQRTEESTLPPGYSRSRDYGWLLAYDGNQYTTAVPTPTILDNMIAAKAIPPVIAVFLESPNRDVEFRRTTTFQRFVGARRLMPQLRAHYRTEPGRLPQRRARIELRRDRRTTYTASEPSRTCSAM